MLLWPFGALALHRFGLPFILLRGPNFQGMEWLLGPHAHYPVLCRNEVTQPAMAYRASYQLSRCGGIRSRTRNAFGISYGLPRPEYSTCVYFLRPHTITFGSLELSGTCFYTTPIPKQGPTNKRLNEGLSGPGFGDGIEGGALELHDTSIYPTACPSLLDWKLYAKAGSFSSNPIFLSRDPSPGF